MRCPNCGRRIPDNSQACPGCKTKFQVKTVGSAVLSGPKLGRLLYFGLLACAILITVLIYLKWQSTGIGESYSLADMTRMYSAESDAANWFVNGTYIVLCLQLLAIIMWIVTYSKPSSVIPLLAGVVTFVGALLFVIMAVFGLSAAFVRIPNFTRTATAIPYLTLLLSAGETVCALYSPALLRPVPATCKTEKTGQPGNARKLLDELDGTVIRDGGKSETGAKNKK